MTSQNDNRSFHKRKTYRVLSGCFGLFLFGVGLYVMLLDRSATLPVLAGGALILLGGNAIVCAVLARESWLSKLGPLP